MDGFRPVVSLPDSRWYGSQPEPAKCNEGCHHSDEQWKCSKPVRPDDDRCSNHNDRQSTSRNRRQNRQDSNQCGKNQSNSPQDFAQADEVKESSRERALFRHLRYGSKELHNSREDKENGQEPLKSPKRNRQALAILAWS